MEISKQEIAIVQKTVEKSQEDAVQVLADLELAMVGGGNGDVVIA